MADVLSRVIDDLEFYGHAVDEIAQAAAPRIRQAIDQQFATGTDPKGSPWAPLAPSTIARGRGNPPLTDTGAMRSSVAVTTDSGQIEVTIDEPAQYHQTGTSYMPQRAILPDEGDVSAGMDGALQMASQEVMGSRG
jgi:hypothetical protein